MAIIEMSSRLTQTGLNRLLEIKDSDIRILNLQQARDAVDKDKQSVKAHGNGHYGGGLGSENRGLRPSDEKERSGGHRGQAGEDTA